MINIARIVALMATSAAITFGTMIAVEKVFDGARKLIRIRNGG